MADNNSIVTMKNNSIQKQSSATRQNQDQRKSKLKQNKEPDELKFVGEPD